MLRLNREQPTKVNKHTSTNVEVHKAPRAMARLSVDIPAPLMRLLKVHAAEKDVTIQRIVLKLLLSEFPSPSVADREIGHG